MVEPQRAATGTAARFARQRALPGFGDEAQDALAGARVLIIGAGGLGSSVIPALAAAGVGRLGIIDDDVVELSNLHRQLIHDERSVGSSKVRSAASRVAALNSTTVVDELDSRLDPATALDLFARYDLVVDGSDNFATRYLANDAAALTGIPLVWGAVSQYGGQAGVAWAAKGPQYRDLFPTPPPPGSVLSCEAGGVLPSVVAVVGAIMAGEVVKILTGIGEPLIGRVTTYDSLSGTFRELAYSPDPTAEPIAGLIDYDAFCGVPRRSDSVTPAELEGELESAAPPLLLDVREEWEAAIGMIPGAVLVPLGHLAEELDGVDPTLEVIAYCHHGIRSATALTILREHGFDRARHLEGGIDAWSREIDPTIERY